MQAFLEQVVKGLVDHPDAVAITELEQERTTVYELRLDPTDVGRIIGKSGRTINAIRSLMQAGSAKAGKFTRLEVIDEKDDAADEALYRELEQKIQAWKPVEEPEPPYRPPTPDEEGVLEHVPAPPPLFDEGDPKT